MAEGTAAGNATEIGPIKATITARDASYTATFAACAAETQRLEVASRALDAEMRQTDSAMRALPAEAERVATGMKHAAHEAAGLDHTLHALKAQTGRRSALGELAELAQGAGPLIGLGLMGEAIKKASEKMLELREEFEKGEKSSGQMADELIRSLPILGSIYEAGRNIRELLTGEEGIAKEIQESAKFADEVAESLMKVREVTREWGMDAHKSTEEVERLIKSAGMSKLGRELFNLSNDFDDRVRDLTEEYRKRVGGEDIKDLQAKLAKANAELREKSQRATDMRAEHEEEPDYYDSDEDRANLKRLNDEASAAADQVKKLERAIRDMHKAETDLDTKINAAAKLDVRMSAQAIAEAFGEAMHRALEKSRPAFEVWRHNLEEARDQVKEVRDRVAEWGLTESDLAVKKLQLIGATKSQVDEVRHLSAELERLDEINNIDKGDVIDTYLAKTKALTDEFNRQAGSKLQLADATKKLDEQYKHALETEAKSWRDKIETPAQKLAENLKHLEAIRAAGDFRSDSEYRAAVQKARQEYEQEIGAGGDHTPRGVDSRSADAADLIARSLNRSAGADIAAQQLAQQMGMGQTLRQIAANTAKTSSGPKPTRYGGL
jgi:hypothetical protein